jgi:hypothetical protein
MTRVSKFLVVSLLLATPSTARPRAKAPPEIEAVRAVVAEVDALIAKRKLRSAQFGPDPLRWTG